MVVYSSVVYYNDMFEAALTVNVTCLLAMSSFFSSLFQSLPSTSRVNIMSMLHIKNILFSTGILFLQTTVVKVCQKKSKTIQFLVYFIKLIPVAGIGLDLIFILTGILYEYEIFTFVDIE